MERQPLRKMQLSNKEPQDSKFSIDLFKKRLMLPPSSLFPFSRKCPVIFHPKKGAFKMWTRKWLKWIWKRELIATRATKLCHEMRFKDLLLISPKIDRTFEGKCCWRTLYGRKIINLGDKGERKSLSSCFWDFETHPCHQLWFLVIPCDYKYVSSNEKSKLKVERMQFNWTKIFHFFAYYCCITF